MRKHNISILFDPIERTLKRDVFFYLVSNENVSVFGIYFRTPPPPTPTPTKKKKKKKKKNNFINLYSEIVCIPIGD